jgi:uncharacterized protein YndB with AHSA1/START domain
MTDVQSPGAYGVLTGTDTLTIQRRLPGPIERVWSYLTDGELRRQWLAAGTMEMKVGATTEFVWRNDELTDPPGARPEGFGPEHTMTCRMTEYDPPRRLGYLFGKSGEVTFDLEPRGDRVLLTLTHARIPDRGTLLSVSAGWHGHLDVLAARAESRAPAPFWEAWTRLKSDYERRLPA